MTTISGSPSHITLFPHSIPFHSISFARIKYKTKSSDPVLALRNHHQSSLCQIIPRPSTLSITHDQTFQSFKATKSHPIEESYAAHKRQSTDFEAWKLQYFPSGHYINNSWFLARGEATKIMSGSNWLIPDETENILLAQKKKNKRREFPIFGACFHVNNFCIKRNRI